MSIEFVRIPQPCFPPVYRYKYTVNGQELGFYSLRELQIMKDGAESDLRHIEGWMDEEVVQHVRELLAALNKVLSEAAA